MYVYTGAKKSFGAQPADLTSLGLFLVSGG